MICILLPKGLPKTFNPAAGRKLGGRVSKPQMFLDRNSIDEPVEHGFKARIPFSSASFTLRSKLSCSRGPPSPLLQEPSQDLNLSCSGEIARAKISRLLLTAAFKRYSDPAQWQKFHRIHQLNDVPSRALLTIACAQELRYDTIQYNKI